MCGCGGFARSRGNSRTPISDVSRRLPARLAFAAQGGLGKDALNELDACGDDVLCGASDAAKARR
jgi:hypothetical protein